MMPSGIAVAATIPAGSTPPSYVASKSIDFDGVNDYVTLGLVPPMEGAPNDGTARCFAFWIKTTDSNYGRWIIGKGDNFNTQYQWGVQSLFGDIAVWCGGGISFGSSVNDGAWHHVAVSVRDVSGTPTMEYWIDAISQGTNTAYDALLDERDWLVGAIRDADNTDRAAEISQQISNLTMWSGGDFDQAKIDELYNDGVPFDPNEHSLAANLIGWWKFGDDDAYPTLTDSVNGNHGTMVNMDSGDIVEDAPA